MGIEEGLILRTTDEVNSLTTQMYNNIRAMHRFVRKDSFTKFYRKLGKYDAQEVLRFVASMDIDGLKRFMGSHEEADLEAMTIRDLRRIGKELNLDYYSRLSRVTLIQDIKKERIRRAKG